MNHHEQELRAVSTPIDTDKTNGNRLGPARRLAGAAAAVTLALTLAACGSVAAEGPSDDDKQTSASPSPEATPDTLDYKIPHDYTDEELLALENEPLPEALAPYEAMGVAEFEALPVEERLTYCSYLNRDQDYIENEFYEGYNQDTTYLLPDNFTEESSAQEVISASGIFTKAAMVSHFGGATYDRDTQQKILACGWLSPSSENPSSSYKFWTDARDASNITGTPALHAEAGQLKYGQATGEAPTSTVTTPDGEEYFARTISHEDYDGNSYEDTFVLVDYTDYKGEPRSVYVNYDAVE